MLVVELVFHKQTPSGVERVAVPFGHTSSNLPELLENFTENSPAHRPMQAQASKGVVIYLARSKSSQDPSAPVIELMSGELDFHNHGHVLHERAPAQLVQCALQVLHSPLSRAIVAGITRRAVEGQHQVLLQDGIDSQAVER